MALVKCGECGREVSDKATNCPNCGAPVDADTAVHSPASVSYDNGLIVGTSTQLAELAKKAVANLNYRVDNVDGSSGTLTFTTGMTMGSWSGVSGTISWEEKESYRWELSGQGKQNVQGGQMVALNLFDEANAKARKVTGEMFRLAGGPAEVGQEQGGMCLVLMLGMGGMTVAFGTVGSLLV